MSAINEAEVLSKLVDRGYDSAGAAALLSQLSVVSVPFDSVLAEATAALRTPTRPLGLSLADRACLALSAQLGLRALTADRAWERVELLVPVVVIR